MSFLKAEWRKLAIANYKVDPSILEHLIPPGTELDLWKENCYISLVGFMFVNTKVLGVKIPFHTNFEEVNLRFYVKRFDNGEWKRGVVFIKELVPKRAITFVANTLYKENYETVKMSHNWNIENHKIEISYRWIKNGTHNNFEVIADNTPSDLSPNSETEFITEHYWGYARTSNNTSNEYEVTHPKWQTYPVRSYKIDVDYRLVYGDQFTVLNTIQPSSVMLAEGSLITVENKRKITIA